MNYTDLETAIQDYCQSDEARFVANINNFIKSAEDKIFFALEGPQYWKVDETGTFSSGTDEYTIGSGAIDILDLYCLGGDATTPGDTLERKDHSFLREAFPQNTGAETTGMPRFYATRAAVIASNESQIQFTVSPVPDATYTYHISYYGKITTDSITSGNTPGGGATTETWLSVVYPTILKDGAVAEGYRFLKADQPEIDRFEIPFQQALQSLKNMNEVRQISDKGSWLGSVQTSVQG